MQHRRPTCTPCLQDHLTGLGYRQTLPCSLSGLHEFSSALLLANPHLHEVIACGGDFGTLLCRSEHDGGCQMSPTAALLAAGVLLASGAFAWGMMYPVMEAALSLVLLIGAIWAAFWWCWVMGESCALTMIEMPFACCWSVRALRPHCYDVGLPAGYV